MLIGLCALRLRCVLKMDPITACVRLPSAAFRKYGLWRGRESAWLEMMVHDGLQGMHAMRIRVARSIACWRGSENGRPAEVFEKVQPNVLVKTKQSMDDSFLIKFFKHIDSARALDSPQRYCTVYVLSAS